MSRTSRRPSGLPRPAGARAPPAAPPFGTPPGSRAGRVRSAARLRGPVRAAHARAAEPPSPPAARDHRRSGSSRSSSRSSPPWSRRSSARSRRCRSARRRPRSVARSMAAWLRLVASSRRCAAGCCSPRSAFWVGTALGVWAIVQGIIAIVTIAAAQASASPPSSSRSLGPVVFAVARRAFPGDVGLERPPPADEPALRGRQRSERQARGGVNASAARRGDPRRRAARRRRRHRRAGSAGSCARPAPKGSSTQSAGSWRPSGRPMPTRTRANSGESEGLGDVADAVVAAVAAARPSA